MKQISCFLVFFAILLFLCGISGATELKPGDKAPDFSLKGSDGKMYCLSDLLSKVVVLAWFPKAFTGG